jgi:hypothetical protein
MDQVRLNQWKNVKFHDPEHILTEFAKVAPIFVNHAPNEKVRTLRTKMLQPHLQGRQGALFCYGMQSFVGSKVYFARHEGEDYDIVTMYERNREIHHTPVQLKELVPEALNPKATLQAEIEKLKKYPKGPVVAVHLNRRMRIDLTQLKRS